MTGLCESCCQNNISALHILYACLTVLEWGVCGLYCCVTVLVVLACQEHFGGWGGGGAGGSVVCKLHQSVV